MLTTTEISPRALEMVVDGPMAREDVSRALDTTFAFAERVGGRIDMLADVRGTPDIHWGIIAEELKRIGDMFRLIGKLDRIALIADHAWLRGVARVESALIPGIHYEVYERAEAAQARAWLLRETDEAHAK
jgi:SpoIIAA-like